MSKPERAKPRRTVKKVQVYLWPNVEQDRLVLDVIEAMRADGRQQEFLRQVMRTGLRRMHELGEIPPEVAARARLDKRMPIAAPVLQMVGHGYPHPGYGHYPPPSPQDAAQNAPGAAPAAPAAPVVRMEPKAERPSQRPLGRDAAVGGMPVAKADDDEMDGILALMGSNRS